MYRILLCLIFCVQPHTRAALQYPINASSLVPCQGASAFALCRPPVDWSPDVLEYISQLDITDPYFYDAFEESEIYNWFRPSSWKGTVPFYLWEDEKLSRDVTTDAPAFLQDLYATFMQDMRQSAWRTRNSTEAVLHFIAVPWVPWVVQGSYWNPQQITTFLEKIAETPEFHRHNGTNFFYITSGWQQELALGAAGSELFSAISLGAPFQLSTVSFQNAMLRLMGGFHYASFPVLRTCTITTHYSATEQLRSQRRWPGGGGESYLYPLGHFAQMQKKRDHKFFFVGQADSRAAYSTRRELFKHKMPFICSDGVIMRTSGGPEMLEKCTQDSMCQCQLPHEWRSDIGAQLLLDSLFAFHIKGDDYYSARIVDIIASGAIPIIVDKILYGMSVNGQCAAPWRSMAIYVDLDDFTADPEKATRQAINALSHQQLEKMVRLLYYYRDRSVNGKYMQSRVGEDRMSQYISECVPEAVLQKIWQTGGRGDGPKGRLSKLDHVCEFEDFIIKQTLPLVNDEDDHPAAWDCLFLREDECPLSSLENQNRYERHIA